MRATAALETAGVPYAVAGSKAVAAWIARVDPAAVRNTPEVDLLVRRSDFDRAANALEIVGFVRSRVAGVDIFLDGPSATPRHSVRLIPACEKFRIEDLAASPDVAESESFENFRVMALEPLVGMTLGSFSD